MSTTDETSGPSLSERNSDSDVINTRDNTSASATDTEDEENDGRIRLTQRWIVDFLKSDWK